VTGQPFFFTIAGMALSVAGFAGLLTAFRRDEAWTPTELWRLRGIVRLSFILMFIALLPFPLFLVIGEDGAIAITSVVVASVYAHEVLGLLRERARWGWARWLVGYLAMDAFIGATQVANVVLVAPAILMFALLVRLAHPVGLFIETIRSFDPAQRAP
jgi:hypothetical protein